MKNITTLIKVKRSESAARRLWTDLLALPAGLVLLAGCGKTHQGHAKVTPKLPSVQVCTQTVNVRPLVSAEELVGTVRAKLRATVETRISGRITHLPVVLGEKLKAGALIACLDAPEIKARLDQAEASFQQAERDAKRISSLFNQQAATRADYEAAESRYRVAQGIVAEARALMGFAEIRAPFEGVVTRKWADVGDQAAPGKPLMDLENPSQLQLEADVPEAIVSGIRQGVRMTVRVEHSPDPSELFGILAEISPVADPTSRTFPVKLDVPASPELRSGQFARLVVPVGESTSMCVPASAVITRGQMEFVFVVKNQRAGLRLVRTGRLVGDETEILSGLDPRDSVVVDNPQQLADGQPLQEK